MSFLWDWVTGALGYLGLWKVQAKLVFLGLDNAGKTTLLHMLKDDRMGQPVPTYYPTKEELRIEGVTFTTFDLGGHKTGTREGNGIIIIFTIMSLPPARKVWKDYFPAVDAIVFLIDIQDQERLTESKEELQGLLSDEEVSDAPILILGNKIDAPKALPEETIRDFFNLHGVTTGKGNISRKDLQRRPVELFMTSVLKRQGYGEGFRWLSQYL